MLAKKQDRVLLLDLNNIGRRNFHMLARLTNGGVYGTMKTLSRYLRDLPSTAMIGVWDGAKAKNIKRQFYPEYKKHRPKGDLDEWAKQSSMIHVMMRLLGIPAVLLSDHEADDVIAVLACRLANKRIRTVIVSEDQDFLPLLRKKLRIYAKNRLWSAKSLSEHPKYAGLTPEQVLIMRIVNGDTSDNIKGVPGYGEVKAKAFAARCSSIAQAERLVEKKYRSLFRTNVQLMRLPELTTDVTLTQIRSQLKVDFNPDEMLSQFEQWNMKSLVVTKHRWIPLFKQHSRSAPSIMRSV